MLTQTQKLLLFSSLMVSTQAGKCPYGFGGSDDDKAKPDDHVLPQLDDVVISSDDKKELRKLEAVPKYQYPSQLFQCSESDGRPKALRTSDNFTTQEYEDVAESVNELYEEAEDKTAFAGCLVRLAGHDLMDFRYSFKNKKDGTPSKSAINQRGGVDGCINFNDKENKGLVECIEKIGVQKAYDKHCGVVSLADFIVIAAEATMARTSNSYEKNYPLNPYTEGTLARTFRDQFQYGRKTEEQCDWNTGLMPDPENGFDDLQEIFFDHIFKYDNGKVKKRHTAAIMGAHTIGSAKLSNSGYEGSWSANEGTFDNDYYKQMLTRGWGPQRAVNGDEGRNQWKVVDNGPDGGMMLNTDLALAYDNNAEHQKCMKENNNNNRKCKKLQNKGKSINALHSECCAWTHKGALFNKGVLDKKAGAGSLCGAEVPVKGKASKFDAVREVCCSKENAESTGDCDSSQWPKGKMFPLVLTFAADEEQWLESFTQAWKIATENGHIELQQLEKVSEEGEEEEENENEEAECGKLMTRKLCETEWDLCTWQKSETKTKRGKFRFHCDLASKAPPKKVLLTEEEKAAKKALRDKTRAEMKAKKALRDALRQKRKEEKAAKKAANEAAMAEKKAKREELKVQMEYKKAMKEQQKAERLAKKEQQNAERLAKKALRDQEKAEKAERRKQKMARNKSKKQNGGSLMEEQPLKP